MLKIAIDLAIAMPYIKGQERICAVVTDRRGKVLSVGYNSYNNSCRLQRFYAKVVGLDDKVFSHAEIDALNRLLDTDKPYSIYVARVNRKGLPLLSKPCKICEMAITRFGVKNVEYTK